jgi:Ca-activated chloride channel family protein
VGRVGRVGGIGRRALVVLVALILPALPGLPALPALVTAQEPSFRSGSSELVVLPVVVTDKQGRYISDLDRERFVVYDNGRRVPIEIFTNEDTPLTVGLVIDSSGSMRTKMGQVVAASLAFARSSNPEDELFAIRFNDDVRTVLGERQFLMADDHGALAAALGLMRPDGRTALYDALVAGLERLAGGSRARKVLIVVSDGGDNASQATLDGVLTRARSSNAAIYTIGIFDDDDLDRNPGVLKRLARTTGGERFLPRTPAHRPRNPQRLHHRIRPAGSGRRVPSHPRRDRGARAEADRARAPGLCCRTTFFRFT